jgi:hypothetical protein
MNDVMDHELHASFYREPWNTNGYSSAMHLCQTSNPATFTMTGHCDVPAVVASVWFCNLSMNDVTDDALYTVLFNWDIETRVAILPAASEDIVELCYMFVIPQSVFQWCHGWSMFKLWRVLVACFCVFAHAEIPCDCIYTYYYVYNYYCYKYFYDQYNVSMVESVCLYSRVWYVGAVWA